MHGYRVTVKGRTFKRGTSILKHSRYLQNLVVMPVYPEPIVEAEAAEGEENDEDGEEE